MTTVNYLPPVDCLLTYGNCRNDCEWPNYVAELGLETGQIPELICMATAPELNWADADSTHVWAPVHAWRALGQLQAEAAIEPLLTLFDRLEDSDWLYSEMPKVYGSIGPASVPILSQYLADPSHEIFARATAANCLSEIGDRHPEVWSECVNVIMRQIDRYANNEPLLNACLLSALNDLKATSSSPLKAILRKSGEVLRCRANTTICC